MIGDKLILRPYHYQPAKDIYTLIKTEIKASGGAPYFITIGGESGCGKSTLAIALKEVLSADGWDSFILHMDDYFHLPPTSNHLQRMDDINHVGPQEVDLGLLQNHIDSIKNGVSEIVKPLIHYKENDKRSEIFRPANLKVIIIEGTYVSLLKNIDSKVFMLRTYKDTKANRATNARDSISPFIEDVLQIEHSIIKKHRAISTILVDKEYNVLPVLL
jgi:uridine kinase